MNIVIPCSVFGLISVCALLPSMGAFEDKMALITTMLLTVVAFKLIQSEWSFLFMNAEGSFCMT